MKRLLSALFLMVSVSICFGAGPTFQSFTPADFKTNALNVWIDTNKFPTKQMVTNIVNAVSPNSGDPRFIYVSPLGSPLVSGRGTPTNPTSVLYDYNGTTRSGACVTATNGDIIVLDGTKGPIVTAVIPLNVGVTLLGQGNPVILRTNRIGSTNNVFLSSGGSDTYNTSAFLRLNDNVRVEGVIFDLYPLAPSNTIFASIINNRKPEPYTPDGTSPNDAPNTVSFITNGAHFAPSPFAYRNPWTGVTNVYATNWVVEDCQLRSISDIIYPAAAWFSQIISRYGNTNDVMWLPDPIGDPTFHNYDAMTWSYITNEMGRMEGTFNHCFFKNGWDGIYPSGDAISITLNDCEVEVDPTFTGSFPHGIKASLGAKVWFNRGTMTFRTNAVNGGYAAVVQADGPATQYITGQPIRTEVHLDGPVVYNTNSAAILLDAPVGAVSGWFVDASNMVSTVLGSYPLATFASSSNAFFLANDYADFTATTNVSITNLTGVGVGQYRWGTLRVTNSSGGTIAVFTTAPFANPPIGSASSNGLQLASGKVGFFSYAAVMGRWTNYSCAVQQ